MVRLVATRGAGSEDKARGKGEKSATRSTTREQLARSSVKLGGGNSLCARIKCAQSRGMPGRQFIETPVVFVRLSLSTFEHSDDYVPLIFVPEHVVKAASREEYREGLWVLRPRPC